MDIFFSGSIRGGRDDADLYATLIDQLNEHGTVLTEHIGEENVEEKEAKEGLTDTDIHDQDVEWLQGADVVVAEVTTTSIGVGYEIGRAVEHGTPILCLYRPATEGNLSAMIRGNDAVELVEYDAIDEGIAAINSFLQRQK